ncbi:TPA: hypothetical protein DIV45_01190 [Patescibacteria group bacterium]|nr:hypothetical protein [Patescibacteria group bacterium]
MAETIQQSALGEIINSETALVLSAEEKYGGIWNHALDFMDLLGYFAKSIDPDRFIFAIFLGHVKKHYLLSILSAVRLHHVQTGMNIRQLIEAGSWAAYSIANPEQSKFSIENDGILDVPDNLREAKDKWLDANHKQHSDSLKNLKATINKSTGHANLVYSMKSFKADFKQGNFHMPFFDYEEPRHIKSDLWFATNVVMGLLDLFYGINQPLNAIQFQPDFAARLVGLRQANDRFKSELMKDFQLEKVKNIVKKIVQEAQIIKDKHTDEVGAVVNYACIFAQSQTEYNEMETTLKEWGKAVHETKTGFVYKIPPLETSAGELRLLKLRKPDSSRLERGDADFTVSNYPEFKEKYLDKPGFGIIERSEMEIMELKDSDFNILVYFSYPTLEKVLEMGQ